jgi:hypothetical protein
MNHVQILKFTKIELNQNFKKKFKANGPASARGPLAQYRRGLAE